MKKILISALALTLTVALVGCGNSANSATITSLGNQLDETANTVSKIQTVTPSSVTISKNALENMANTDAEKTQNSLLNEENYKTAILLKTAQIKRCLNNNLKLSKAQISAVKDLTSNLCKYTNSVSYSKNELDNTLKTITSLKKREDKNAEKITAKLNRLICNSNARSAYYENIINTLEQLGSYFECEEEIPSDDNTTLEDTTQEETSNQSLTKNIDTYLPQTDEEEPTIDKEYINYNPTNQYYRPTVYNRFERFNMSRNTDTYGPRARNIDSLYGYNTLNRNFGYGRFNGFNNGFYGNGIYGANKYYGNLNSNNFNRYYANDNSTIVSTPGEQRLETEEILNENNVLENVEETDEAKDVFKPQPRSISIPKEDDQPIVAH